MSNIFDLFKKIEKEAPAEASNPVSYIVAGLGNPGDKYTHTRHNTGFMALDYISQKENIKINSVKFKSLCKDTVIFGKRVLFMKPQTFMNNSGEALKEAADFYKIPPERIIVIFDDVCLDVGRLRVRRNGSAGGHNGIKSIIEHIGSDNFPRIKIGVGEKPHPDYDLADWVLGTFSAEDKEKFFSCLEDAYNGLHLILDGKIEDAMAACNSKKS